MSFTTIISDQLPGSSFSAKLERRLTRNRLSTKQLAELLEEIFTNENPTAKQLVHVYQAIQLVDADHGVVADDARRCLEVTLRMVERLIGAQTELSAPLICSGLMSLKKFNNDSFQIRQLLAVFSRQLQQPTKVSKLSSRDLAGALQAFRCMRRDSDDIVSIMSSLTKILLSKTFSFSANETCKALTGVRNMKGDMPELCSLLSAMAPKVAAGTDTWNARDLSTSLNSLRWLTADSAGVREILAVLAIKTSASSCVFNARDVGQSLFGLRHMSSDVVEVRALLAALAPKIAACSTTLDIVNANSARIGILSMSTAIAEVQSVVDAINSLMPAADAAGRSVPVLQIKHSELLQRALRCISKRTCAKTDIEYFAATLDASAGAEVIVTVFSCLRFSEPREIVNLSHLQNRFFAALIAVIEHETLDVKQTLNCLAGLKHCNGHEKSVRSLLAALSQLLQNFPSTVFTELSMSLICTSLLGLRSMSSNTPEVRLLLAQLARVIVSNKKELSGCDAGWALQSLRFMDCRFLAVRLIVAALAEKIEICQEVCSAVDISNMMHGLQSMTDSTDEVLALLHAVEPHVSRCPEPLTPYQIGTALYGLKNMRSETRVVRDILRALAPKVAACSGHLSPQSIGNALYGMKRMNSEIREVQDILSALAPKISSCSTMMLAQEVSNSLYGLQGMRSSEPAVRAIIKQMVLNMSSSSQEFSSQHISNSLYGLNRMKSDSDEVVSLLHALESKISSSRAVFSEQAVVCALYGLRHMSGDSIEVRKILLALHSKVASCRDSLTPQGLCIAVYGLRGVGGTVEAKAILSVLLSKSVFPSPASVASHHVGNFFQGLRLFCSSDAVTRKAFSYAGALIQSCDHFIPCDTANCLNGLRRMTDDCLEVRALLRLLADRIDLSQGDWTKEELSRAFRGFSSQINESSVSEGTLSALSKKLAKNHDDFDAASMKLIFIGMKNFSSSHQEVRDCLSIITSKIKCSSASLSIQDLSAGVYCLRCMSCGNTEVTEFLAALNSKFKNCHGAATPSDMAYFLNGIRNMSSSCETVRELLMNVVPLIDSCERPFVGAKQITMAISGLRGMSCEYSEVRALLRVLAPKIEACRQPNMSPIHQRLIYDSLANLRAGDINKELFAVFDALVINSAKSDKKRTMNANIV